MSYCVNCGVELDTAITACPLCGTKVYHPDRPVFADTAPPYASVKGTVETVRTKEFTILMTIIFMTTAVVCLLLNLLFIRFGHWSFYVTGICCTLWVFFIPLFFPKKAGIYTCTALDGLSILLFLAMISGLHPNQNWFVHIGLPVTLSGTLLLEIIFLFAFRLKSSMIIKTVISVTGISVYCLAIESAISMHLLEQILLSWSPIVATCAAAIDIILMTIYLREGLRSEFRRRLHF